MRRLFLKDKFIIVLIVYISFSNCYVYAKDISSLKKKQSEINKESSNLKKNISELQIKKSNTEKELREVDYKLENIVSEIDIISDNLSKVQQKLNITKEELKEAENLKKQQNEIFIKRIKSLYKNSKITYLDVILKSNSFIDLIKRLDYIDRIVKYDNNLLKDLIQNEKTIAKKIEDIERQKIELEVLESQELSKKQGYEDIKGKKEILINKFVQESDKYKDRLNYLDKSNKDIEALIKAKQKEAKLNYGYSGGRLAWPVPGKTRISSGFGMRVHPITKVLKGHTGIDIPAPCGSAIIASEDGVVISSGYLNGYGNTVVIDHGNNMSTLYAHNSKNVVRVGESVKKGNIIAKVGSTGFATGNHLHFEVRISGTPNQPLKYLK